MSLARPARHTDRAARWFAGLCASVLCIGMLATAPETAGSRRPDAAPATADAGSETATDGTRVALGPGGRDLRLAGDFTDGVAARVAGLLADHPEVERIHLTSDGGLVEEAEAVGALIAGRGLATYVPDACASACTLAFVRGRRRYLAEGASLGFHAPYEEGSAGAMLAVDAAPERAAYVASGIRSDFVERALTVPSEEIWIPDAALLLAAGVATEIVGTDRFPDSTLDADPSPQGARDAVLRNLPILAKADSAALAVIAGWYRDGYAAGRPEAEAIEGLRRMASEYLRRRFRAADDATVRAFGQTTLAALHAAGTEACAAIAGGDLVAIDETLKGGHVEVASLDALIGRAPRAGVSTPGPSARGGGWRPAAGCATLIPAIRRALAHPDPAAATAVRALLLQKTPTDLAALGGP